MTCTNHVDVDEGVLPCARCGRNHCGDCLVVIHGQPHCAICKSEKLLDLQSGTDQWELRLAGIGRRFAALWLDQMMFAVIVVAVFIAAAMMLSGPLARTDTLFTFLLVGFIAVYLGFVVYEALMLASRGQTLGKMALRIKVVRPDGAPITRGQAWGRAALRAVMVHILSLLNYIPAFATKEKTCIHDLVAKTRVVNVE